MQSRFLRWVMYATFGVLLIVALDARAQIAVHWAQPTANGSFCYKGPLGNTQTAAWNSGQCLEFPDVASGAAAICNHYQQGSTPTWSISGTAPNRTTTSISCNGYVGGWKLNEMWYNGCFQVTNSTYDAATLGCKCNNGYTPSGGVCVSGNPSTVWPQVAADCPGFKDQTFRGMYTVGWDTTPNPATGSKLAVERQPTETQIGSCKAIPVAVVKDDTGFAYCSTESQPGSTGMYTTRCYIEWKFTGEAAAPSVPSMASQYNPDPPACTGSLGTVAGVVRCLPVSGTTQVGTQVAPLVNPDGSQTPRVSTTGIHDPGASDGGRNASVPGSPGTLSTPGTGLPNPAGQGRTPVDGKGASITGSGVLVSVSGAGEGGGGGGGGPDYQSCGRPGQPKCQIDETGTEAHVDALETKKTDATTAFDAHKAKLDAATSGSNAGELGVPGLSQYSAPSSHEQGSLLHSLFPAPTACAPLTFGYRGGLTINHCGVVSYAMPILEWLLYALTLFYVYALFWRRRQGAA